MRSKAEIEAAAKALCWYGDPLENCTYPAWDVLPKAAQKRLIEAACEALSAADEAGARER